MINGACERCGTPVVRRDLTQWFFKITDYAQRLLDDMESLEWPERVITMQRNWIGRSEGASVTFEIAETGDAVEVFTTRPDTLWGVTFFVFAPEHPLVSKLVEAGGAKPEIEAVLETLRTTPLTSREEADTREGIPLGVHAVNPVNGEQVPVFVAPYVLMEYGTGAVMGVPAHDQRDFEFARAHDLPIRVVVQPEGEPARPGDDDRGPRPRRRDGELGTVRRRAVAGVHRTGDRLARGAGQGRRSGHLPAPRLADQPPAVLGRPDPDHALPEHGEVAVPDDQLPVLLPDDVDFRPGGESPLARHEGFVNTVCPICGEPAKRDTDTMDTFVDSAWYYYRYCSPHEASGPFDPAAVERWMPVDQYIGGVEHAILHLLYCRFFTKVLFDMGMVGFTEPMKRMMNQGQVIFGGASMSKSKGNIVEPMPLVERWGADSIRLNILFAGPFEDDIDWKLIAPGPREAPWRDDVARPRLRGRRGGVRTRRPGPRAAPAPDPPDDPSGDRRHGTLPVQRRDQQTAGADERDTLDAGRGRRRSGGCDRARDHAGAARAVREPRSSGARCSATPRACTWRRGRRSIEALARDETVTLVVQVDGKVRDRIEVAADADEETCRELALASEKARQCARRARDRQRDRPAAAPGQPGHVALGTRGTPLNIHLSRPDRDGEAGVRPASA